MCSIVIICCAKDFCPFSTIEGDGFIGLVQTIIDTSLTRGRMNAKDLLSSATTVKNHLMSIDQKLRVALAHDLVDVKHVNCTTDHWSGK